VNSRSLTNYFAFLQNSRKNETQILDAIKNYYNNLYTSAGSATQDEFDEFTQELHLPKLSDEE